ncbi:MAG TPA: LamG-like jellyroll fold domain-containing protein [Verrucomicrobiae bacterium]
MRKKYLIEYGLMDIRLALSVAVCIAGTAYGQYLPQNVCQPGDPLVASSANSPGSEGVANAIDGTTTKYLNFDTSTGHTPPNAPSGFIVTPSVGMTWLSGVAIQSANDAPERDPHHFTIEGSNDDPTNFTSFAAGNWTMVADVTIDYFTNRYQWQTAYFVNYGAFKSYRWTVLQVSTNNGCCMQVAEVQLLGTAVPKVVTTPGDPIFASSANSPGSEGVANAIDGTTTKYLNFDTSTGHTPPNAPSGFAVTPSVGATLINGITMQSANDAPERDPKAITIEGSNDAITGFSGGNWELIYSNGNIPVFAGRYASQTFVFPNVKPYKSYRWTVVQVQTNNGCCMQIAEVSLLGAGAPQNVVVPSDSIIASSANSPGSEGVANAIDGTTTKYLNFDTSTGHSPPNAPSGFVVTPSVGSTVIIGMGIQSANDAPERDPKHVTLEGSNDDTANWSSGAWTTVADLQFDYFTNRYQWQYLYFQNQLPFKHYRWTVLEVATNNGCCMQVAEVQLLAVTAKADCTKAAFVSLPTDMPVLAGSQATFFAAVNGPWPLQWASNGITLQGATKSTFTTVPITTANAGAAYTLSIVGCQTSAPVHAVVFTPSTIQSVGIQFAGGGANGAPTYIRTNDIAGQHLQAFWNIATNANGNVANTNGIINPLRDSSNNVTTITFNYATSGTWGAGVGSDQPVQRLLNGIVGSTGASGGVSTDQILTFSNVPAGTHSLLVYAISPPLQFQTVSYYVANQVPLKTNYIRVMNSDEYKPSPGFYRGLSTSLANPDTANFLRFDELHPAADGTITLVYDVLTETTSTIRETGVNAIQLLLNAGSVGNPPVITQQPQPTVAPQGYPATLTVVATGTGLSYQWRKGGVPVTDGGHLSGANTDTLTIFPLSAADEGIYSVEVINAVGTTVSKNAAVNISKYDIQDRLVSYWKFDEGSGTNVANSVAGGEPATLYGNAFTWDVGKVGNAFTWDPYSNYGLVSNYTKATKQIAGSVWVKWPLYYLSFPQAIFKNAAPDLITSGGAGTTHGQFSLDLVQDSAGTPLVRAVIGLGPNIATAIGTTPVPNDNAWHHVAFSADGAQLKVYLDGQLNGSVDYLADINVPDIPWLAIGANMVVDTVNPPASATGTNYFWGTMDELALWTRALTATEVTLLNNAGKASQSLTNVVETPPAAPATLSSQITGSNIQISWSPAGGHLEATPTLSPAAWTSLANTNPATIPLSGNPQRYFRVVSP